MANKKWYERIFNRKEESRGLPINTLGGRYNFNDSRTYNTTVIACKNMIINPISTLPVKLYYRENDGSKQDGYKHPLYNLIKYKPNPDESWGVFVSRMLDHLIEAGNAFVFKVYDLDIIKELYLLNPKEVIIEYDTNNRKVYKYRNQIYNWTEVVHIPGKYPTRYGGISLTTLSYDSINVSNRLEDYSKYYFENMISGGRLKVNIDERIKQLDLRDDTESINKEIKNISDYLRNNYSGEQNAGKPLIEPNGAKVEQLETSSNQDAQLLELRTFQEKCIVKVFDIPWDVYSGENKYNSLEGRNEYFKRTTLAFWTNRIEEGLNDLFNLYERNRYFFEFDWDAFLRTNSKERWENYKNATSIGSFTINDILKKENKPCIDPAIGDIRFIPNNWIPLTPENVQAYFAQSKATLEKGMTHNPVGDDKS